MPLLARIPRGARPRSALALLGALFAFLAIAPAANADFGFQFKWGAGGGGGSFGSGDGEFTYPTAVAYFNGEVFVSDQGNNRIQKFSTDGSFVTKWGANGGDGSSGVGDGEFINPSGVAVDGAGDVYVVDSDNSRVQKFTSGGDFIGKWGAGGGDGTPGSGNGEFIAPFGIAVDTARSFVYVTDLGNARVQKFDLSGNYVGQFSTDLVGDTFASQPAGIAVDTAGNVYVTDFAHNRVAKYRVGDLQFLTQWGSLGSGNGEFVTPFGVTVDSGNKVYVTDFGNNRVQTFDSSGNFIVGGTFGSQGPGDGEFRSPTGVGTDPFSNVYVADRLNHRIQRFGNTSGTGKGEISLGTTLLFQAGPGAANNVTISLSGGEYTITDTSAAVTPGDQCSIASANSVTCPAAGVDLIRVETLDRNDSITVTAPTASVLDGGAENDVLSAGAGNDTISGGGGNDTVSYSDASAGVTVGLSTAGPQATGGAGTDTLGSVENLYGSSHDDDLDGDGSDNTLRGDGGTDSINGSGGTDTADYANASSAVSVDLSDGGAQSTGGAGTDTLAGFENLTGSGHNDTLTGDSGDNVINGELGDDNLDGGFGTDTADYSDAASDVTVDLGNLASQNTVGAGSDTLAAFENVTGSGQNDTLTGNSSGNVLNGGVGNDTLTGAGGGDTVAGGNGNDTASYSGAGGGVNASLAIAGSQDTGGAGIDTLQGVENLAGSGNDDVLTGDGGSNTLDGGNGNDTLTGGNGNDAITGGGGTSDTAGYGGAATSVTVDLELAGQQPTGGAGNDTLSGVENLTGSGQDDALKGDGADNLLSGGSGNDSLRGGLGTDTLTGAGGSDTADYSNAAAGVAVNTGIAIAQDTLAAGNDTLNSIENLTGSGSADALTGDAGANTLSGLGGNDALYGLAGSNNLDGGDGNDTLAGGANDDSLNGGTGSDTLDYSTAAAAVSVNLALPFTQSTGGAGQDIISNSENLIGSSQDDTLSGNDAVNSINGADGNDTIGTRDFTADTVDCGLGVDNATADPTDSLAACETAAVENPPPPSGGGGGGGGGGDGGGGAPDGTAPSLSGLSAGKVSIKLGGAFNYSLSEGATVSFTIEKQQLGRKVTKKSCKKQTKRNRKKKVCRRFVKLGGMSHQGSAGPNSAPFAAKVNGKPLKIGVYRLTATPRDAAGNTGKSVQVTFIALR